MKTLFPRFALLLIVATFVATLNSAGRTALAQSTENPDPQSAAEQELRDQMRDVGQQVFAKMIQQGIDPRQFMADVSNSSDGGGFDIDVLTQKLVEKNLIDQDTVDELTKKMQQVGGNRLKQQLGVDDNQWDALLPKIQKVVDAAYAAGVRKPGLAVIGLRPTKTQTSDVAKARAALKAASGDAGAKPAEIAEKLEAFRAAKEKAMKNYAQAQQELLDYCSQRQEGVFILVGLLD